MADEKQSTLNSEKTDEKSDAKAGSSNSSIAVEMGRKQREIGVAEFFARNRHLLGFDNKRKALLTVVKEAVDNSLDACEEAGILPEISVNIIDMNNDRFRLIIEDNGPGIVRKQVPKIFGKLLYGSKFHRLKMSRGQQGIGISACVLYSQLTTGRSTKIISRIDPNKPAHTYEVLIDTKTNQPKILKDEEVEWKKPHGTRIEIDIEGSYQQGAQSVDEYIKQTAISNPHTTLIYTNPKSHQVILPRVTETLPPLPEEVKPHPYGVELGVLISMLHATPSRTLQAFLTTEFSRVGAGAAKQICENASLLPNSKPQSLSRDQAEKLIKGIKETKLMNPPTDCISPIGEKVLEKGIRKEINAEFYTTVSRPPSVYRGNPFIVEAGVAYGGDQPGDKSIRLLRYANRVPLLYQQSAGAVFKGVTQTSWRSYGLNQPQGSLPVGPMTLVVHIASVWVPFTSESKEAMAHYPEIIKEIKLAVQELGRKLGSYVRKKAKVRDELQKRSYIEKYIPHVSEALIQMLEMKKSDIIEVSNKLENILEKKRGQVEDLKFDPTKNEDYDENFANIGKESKDDKKDDAPEGGEE